MGGRLFISHASADAPVVGRIVSYLERRDAACWVASRDIRPGAIYADAITDAIRNSSACVVAVSKASMNSDAVKRELELASHYKRAFAPIQVDDDEVSPTFQYYLLNSHWVNFKRDGERALDKIVLAFATNIADTAGRPAVEAHDEYGWVSRISRPVDKALGMGAALFMLTNPSFLNTTAWEFAVKTDSGDQLFARKHDIEALGAMTLPARIKFRREGNLALAIERA